MTTTWLNDTFTDANNSLLTAHTAEIGGTYVAWYGTVVPVIYTNLSGVVGPGASGYSIFRNTVIAPGADVKVSATFNYQSGSFTSLGVCARLKQDGSGGYVATYSKADSKWNIYRLASGGAATLLGSSAATPYTTNSTPSIEFAVTGNGASVALSITIGGVEVASATDASGSRITDVGYGGVLFSGTTGGAGMFIGSMSAEDISAPATAPGAPTIGAATAGDGSITGAFSAPASNGGSAITSYIMSVYKTSDNSLVTMATGASSPITATGVPNDVQQYVKVSATNAVGTGAQSAASNNVAPAAAGNVVAITAPADGKIATLSGGTTGTATFSLGGTYAGAPPNQWRLVPDGGSTSVSGFDWQSFTTAPSAGAFAQTIAGVPKLAGWYNIQVRNSATPEAITSSGKVGAGVLVGVDGQSNAYLFFSGTTWAGDSTLTPSPLVRVTGKQASNAWMVPATATMNGAIACGNALAATLQCPVGLVDGSWDGSGLTMTGNGGKWVPTSGTTYQQSLAAMTAAGGKLIANLWIQGEGDAGAAVTQTAYYDGLTTLIAQRRSDLAAPNLPYVIVTLARNTAGMTDINRERIKLAQVQKCGDANIYRVDRMDLPLHTDGIHHTAAGFTKLGQRCAQAVLASAGAVSQYRGPSIASVVKFSATEFDVSLTHHLGSDFTPTTGGTGFSATDPGASNAAIAVTGAARQAADKIRVTLASAPVGLPSLAYLYGSAPAVSGVVLDNSALSLPLEYNPGVLATAAASVPEPSNTRTVSLVMGDAAGACANLTGMMVGFRLGSGPHNSGTALYQSAAETTDSTGTLSFSFDSSAISAGQSGLLEVLTQDGRHFLGVVPVA